MDDSKQFKQEVNRNIELQGGDNDFREASLGWLIKSGEYKYSYNFEWLGRPIIQLPQDILAMQELIWTVKPDCIIETGVARGGSVVFYASMFELLGNGGKVVGIDVDIRAHNRKEIENHPMFKNIHLIQGSSTDDCIVREVKEYVSRNSFQNVLVALDSNHTHEHVLNELRLYSPFVKKDSYIVVFDTVIEDMQAGAFPDRPWDKGNNPKTAVFEFLKENDRFVIDENMDKKLLISVAPSGYLRCVK